MANGTNTNKKEPWYDGFLTELTRTFNVTKACRKAHVGRTAAYEHRKKNEGFREAWENARFEVIDGLEETLIEQAKKNPTLLIFALKNLKPEVYGERQTIDGNFDISVKTSEAAEHLISAIIEATPKEDKKTDI